MENDIFKLTSKVELFPQKGGWYYVRVPIKFTEATKDVADRGLVAITATIDDISWDTSLLPMGDGTQFIALNAAVRKKGKISLGDKIDVSFVIRER